MDFCRKGCVAESKVARLVDTASDTGYFIEKGVSRRRRWSRWRGCRDTPYLAGKCVSRRGDSCRYRNDINLNVYFCHMKIEREKKTVGTMIRLYCRKCEGNKELCQDCSELLSYAEERLDRCRFGNGKPTCKKCPIHCYKPDMRLKMRAVMRWAGPRMMLYHPIEAIKHLIREKL